MLNMQAKAVMPSTDLRELADTAPVSFTRRRLVRYIILGILTLITLLLVSALAATFIWDGLEVGTPAPHFSGADLNGNNIELSALRGKPVMLTFWSPDCFACREELPHLQAIANDPNANVTLVTVVSKLSAAEVRQFAEEQKLTFPILVDEPGAITKLYDIHGIPFTYFIGPGGAIDRTVIGAGKPGELQNSLFAWLQTCDVNAPCKVDGGE